MKCGVLSSCVATAKRISIGRKESRFNLMDHWVTQFGHGSASTKKADRNTLGSKGASLVEMSLLGLPVPPGMILSTEVCIHYLNKNNMLPKGFDQYLQDKMAELQDALGRKLGCNQRPLMVAVRSGAPVSMPGMMDTILNIGLNDETTKALAAETGDGLFAFDTYRRFIQMYAGIVLGLGSEPFETAAEQIAQTYHLDGVGSFNEQQMQTLIERYKEIVLEEIEQEFPQDPKQQLNGAIKSVLASWKSARAIAYRAMHGLDESTGTAVIIQSMVFGNRGANSATGVTFTRNPSTGERQLFGEYLPRAQGEDVVSGIKTPNPLTRANATIANTAKPTLQEENAEVFSELSDLCLQLETHFGDMQDIEFTIEEGKLWLLQTRSGKRTTSAAIRIAIEMADEGLISKQDAINRIEPASLNQLLHPTLDPSVDQPVITSGLPASPGAASGEVVFHPEDAERLSGENRQSILVRLETSPEDIRGMYAANGILTARGGMTSHAAVVARGMGKPCIVGAGKMRIDYESGELQIMGRTIREGDVVTIDGSSGRVYSGHVKQIQAELSGYFATLMAWADEVGGIKVRANADTPADAEAAKVFGAKGIGLCRTERMFFQGEQVNAVREMILARSETRRRSALAKLVDGQRDDFVEIFKTMAGLPVAIRLLDPPFHEFLPTDPNDLAPVAESLDIELADLEHRMVLLNEVNPMMGNRGCRMLIAHPEIIDMQSQVIFEAAEQAAVATGQAVIPEIMIPVVGMHREQEFIRNRIDGVAVNAGGNIEYKVGTMIELPRAALIADRIANSADFLSFGTNDLTQTTFGISRDDASRYWRTYERQGIFKKDPFVTLDKQGVGELMELSIERGRSTKPDIEVGICGEHGGDPDSVRYCHEIGIDYVSCSPFRVPIARLAAAQSARQSS